MYEGMYWENGVDRSYFSNLIYADRGTTEAKYSDIFERT